jgi:DNA-binding NarL/FixJ family response regulator/class 3 adenylate cyclase
LWAGPNAAPIAHVTSGGTTANGPKITVFLADDSLLVREGVRALLASQPDLDVVGVAEDFDGLVRGAEEQKPQVVVTDIRMPPNFQNEGIEAAKLVRLRNPGTGIVVLSQYDEPEYAISLLSEGAAGYAYLLKDRVGDGDQLVRAVREVATGGSMLDPSIVQALVTPARAIGELDEREEQLLQWIAEGRPVKAIAIAWQTLPEAANDAIEELFLKLAKEASAGREGALRRLRLLQKAIVDREEQGETLSRLLPGGLAEKLRSGGRTIGESERMVVTVLMSDVRGYSGIAERVDPTVLAGMLNGHRAEMNNAILSQGGTVMQYVGDAVMAVFGAPFPQEDHADRALAAACAMLGGQHAVNERWRAARVRARHRLVHGRGCGGAARFRRASGVHARRRHRESRATVAGPGAARRNDRVERAHAGGAHVIGVGRAARRATSEGPGDARAGVPAGGHDMKGFL